jgi:hypothetical protein
VRRRVDREHPEPGLVRGRDLTQRAAVGHERDGAEQRAA